MALMHTTTVRFSEALWERVQLASRDGGMSAAEFVREATAAYVAAETNARVMRRDIALVVRRQDQRIGEVEAAMRRHGLR